MRALTVLLLSTCLAGSAVAQPTAFQRALATPGGNTPTANTPKNANAAMTMPQMIGGKFVVGYEGRGDYVKNAELAKQLSGRGTKVPVPAAANDTTPDDKTKDRVQTASLATKPAPDAAPATAAPAVPKLRSDAALRSDATKAITTANATPPAVAPAAPVSPAPTPGAPNYNPMMLIRGGQMVSQ